MDLRWRDEPIDHDRQAIRRIVESTGFFYPAEVDVAVELVDERLARGRASGYHFAFLESGGDVIGYTCFGPIACTVGSFDLFWIAVAKAAQGGGHGRRLLQKSEEVMAAMGARRIYIETSGRPDYLPTRGFYEKCGYHLAAELPEFYGVGDSKAIYCKALPLA